MAMEDDHVKLLSFWASPYAMRAIVALESKGVKYELIEEDLPANKSQLLLRSNPVSKKVPVLLHNQKAIPESLIIVRYVDEVWPAEDGFFPTDPYGRAITHFWSDFIENKIFEVSYKAMKCKGEEKEAALKEVYQNIMTLENSAFVKLNAKPFLNGSSIGFADITLAPFAAWLAGFEEVVGIRIPSPEEAPHFHSFCSAIFELPAAQIAFPDPQKLLAYVKWLQQRWASST